MLRVIVEHMVYPVTLDVIFQIFSRVGKVLKIVTFTKNNTFQALIQVTGKCQLSVTPLVFFWDRVHNIFVVFSIPMSLLLRPLSFRWMVRTFTMGAAPSGLNTPNYQT